MLQKNVDKQKRKKRKNWVGFRHKIERNKKVYTRKNKHKQNYL